MPCIVICQSLLLQFQVDDRFGVIGELRTGVVYSQTTYESTAQGGLQRLLLLVTSVLEPKKPLKVKHVPLIGQKENDIAPPTLRRAYGGRSRHSRGLRKGGCDPVCGGAKYEVPRYSPEFDS